MPKFENTLSLGNILIVIQLVVMLFAVGTVWGTTTGAITAAAEDRAIMKAQTADQEARIRVLEREIAAGLSRIETELRTLTRQQETGR